MRAIKRSVQRQASMSPSGRQGQHKDYSLSGGFKHVLDDQGTPERAKAVSVPRCSLRRRSGARQPRPWQAHEQQGESRRIEACQPGV